MLCVAASAGCCARDVHLCCVAAHAMVTPQFVRGAWVSGTFRSGVVVDTPPPPSVDVSCRFRRVHTQQWCHGLRGRGAFSRDRCAAGGFPKLTCRSALPPPGQRPGLAG